MLSSSSAPPRGKSPLGDSLAQHGLFGRGSRCWISIFGAELRLAASDGECSAAYSQDELNFIHGLEQGLLLENEPSWLKRSSPS